MGCHFDSYRELDADLLLRYRAGSDSALGQLYAKYEGPVFRFLLGMLRDRHQAEDALQETFIQAVRKSDQVDPTAFRGWLFTVAHQQGVLQKRRGKRFAASTSWDGLFGVADQAMTPEDVQTRASESAAAIALLSELPVAQQTVIRMRIYDGLRFQDVAEKLGIPLGTALARMHDGLKKMRAKWEERYA